MRIYNYLFYKSYLLAQRSKNFDDIPVLGGIPTVAVCFVFNIFTVILLVEGMNINTHFEIKKEYKYLYGLSLVLLLLFYYLYKGRYKKIIERFEKKKEGINLHPVIVIVLYIGISGLLAFLAALFKNRDWIFAQ